MIKNKIVYALSAAMTLGAGVLAPSVFADEGDPFCIEGGGCYSTLQAAFDQVPSNGALTTIYLNSDQDTVYDGGGAFYTAGKGAHPANGNYNVVFDLKGKTYVIQKDPVGSTGYETQAFHLERGGKFTFKDGAVKAASGSGVWFILQNYADTILDNVILDGSDNSGITYVASNNFGSLTVKGESQILASEGRVAFDLWYGMNGSGLYDDGIAVTFGDDFTGKVVGIVEYGHHKRVTNPNWQEKAVLNISNGTFDIEFREGSEGALNGANINISGGVFSAEPNEDEIADGEEAYKTADGYVIANPEKLAEQNFEYADDDKDGLYELMPIKIDMRENGGMKSEGDVVGTATFTKEFIAGRKVSFEIYELDIEDFANLVLSDENGELVAAFDASLWDGDTPLDDVENTEIKIRIELTPEQYQRLVAYDKKYAINYNDAGEEVDRFEVALLSEDGKYYAEFTTTHLSTYALAGVNEETTAAAPETGTMTAAGASATTAAIVTAAAVGLLTSVVGIVYLIRRH